MGNINNLEDLRRKIKGILTLNKADLMAYSTDATRQYYMPYAVAFPEDSEDLVNICKFCYDNEIIMVPRGAGTGQVGGVLPISQNSLVVSFEKMTKIIDILLPEEYIIIEPGITAESINKEIKKYKYFFPVDPGSVKVCTIGGMIAQSAGGTRAVRYGTIKDYVLGLEIILPNGDKIKTGILDDDIYSDVKLNLTDFFVSSEGTLGFISKIALKIVPLFEDNALISSYFNDIDSLNNALSEIFNLSFEPAMIEIIDRATLETVFLYKNKEFEKDIQFMLITEILSNKESLEQKIEHISKILNKSKAHKIEVAIKEEEKEKIFDFRRNISPAISNLELKKINADICVPRSKLKDILEVIKDLKNSYGFNILVFGHAGDGNLHVNIMINSDGSQDVVGKRLLRNLFQNTIELKGVISGEHGIGITKKEYLLMQISAEIISYFNKLKKSFDDKVIFNPGKIV